jgi:pyridinium-3,5-biscarboxylic acid mononucleotide sulfurtransferase
MPAEKYERLVSIVRGYGPSLVAFSGGADSALLAKAAQNALGDRALAVTGDSASISRGEIEWAREMALDIGIPHRVVETNEMEDPEFVANPFNRCYFCKKVLYRTLMELARREGFNAVLAGDNADDVSDYRPGRDAAVENQVRFPLQEAGLTKPEIREISRDLDLRSWDKPSTPCLASRVVYGEPLDPVWLQRIDQGESLLKNLGLRQVRVRHHRDLARIEVPLEDLGTVMASRETVLARFLELGWAFVSLDLGGFRSGSLNRVLKTDRSPGRKG